MEKDTKITDIQEYDEELHDSLIAISVVAKMVARRMAGAVCHTDERTE